MLIDVTFDLITVEKEERLHGSVANPLVPVYEGVIHDKRVAQGGSLGNEVGVEIMAAKRCMRLTNGRFKRTNIADAGGAA